MRTYQKAPCRGSILMLALILFVGRTPALWAETERLWAPEAAPVQLTNINVEPAWGHPKFTGLTAQNGRLYFNVAVDEGGASGLWISDGTPTGTTQLFNQIVSAIAPSQHEGDVIYFATNAGLWKSDGTSGGTVHLLDIDADRQIVRLAAAQNRLYIFTTPVDDTNRMELLVSDGAAGSATLMAELNGYLGWTATMGEKLFIAIQSPFGTTSPDQGLWICDGTAEGTVRLTTTSVWQLRAFDDAVFFHGTTEEHGEELWRSDGTPDGTQMVADIRPGPAGSNPSIIEKMGDSLLFTTGDQVSLWQSDGTAEGTTRVVTLNGSGSPWTWPLARTSNSIYAHVLIVCAPGCEYEYVIRSDGTATGTKILQRKTQGDETTSEFQYVTDGAALNGVVYFIATDLDHGAQLWQNDGHSTEVVLTSRIHPEFTLQSPTNIQAVGDLLYLVASSGTGGQQLWSYRPQTPTALPLHEEPRPRARTFLPMLGSNRR